MNKLIISKKIYWYILTRTKSGIDTVKTFKPDTVVVKLKAEIVSEIESKTNTKPVRKIETGKAICKTKNWFSEVFSVEH